MQLLQRITPAGAGKTNAQPSGGKVIQDHPRRCGENDFVLFPMFVPLGSPPQVRGKLPTLHRSKFDYGITPAGAGKTSGNMQVGVIVWDHPRRCGENLRWTIQHISQSGSPPQVRGKPRKPASKAVITGITPAGAGKTLLLLLKLSACRDHPRRCGENDKILIKQTNGRGSPPQVRGKPRYCLPRKIAIGITPAGAGKTFITTSSGKMTKDHPRRCGENSFRADRSRRRRGSPPQVRGKLNFSCSLLGVTRITPAGAGKTELFFFDVGNVGDHPRRCGENLTCPSNASRRAWITPADAGKTPAVDVRCSFTQDHPRGCGENQIRQLR